MPARRRQPTLPQPRPSGRAPPTLPLLSHLPGLENGGTIENAQAIEAVTTKLYDRTSDEIYVGRG